MTAITFELGRHTLEDVKREMFLAAYDECKNKPHAMDTVAQMLGISRESAYHWRQVYASELAEAPA